MTDTPHPSARYDDRAQRYADAFQDETLRMFPVDRNMIRMLVDLVGGHPRVLDAGCGAGQVTKMLQNWGCDAVGVDAAEKLIELARTAFPGLAFTVGDLRALPYPDEGFDALVARYSVIHTAPDEVPTVAAEFGALLGRAGLVERAPPLPRTARPEVRRNARGAPHLPQVGTFARARTTCRVTTSPPVACFPQVQSDIQRAIIGRTDFTLGGMIRGVRATCDSRPPDVGVGSSDQSRVRSETNARRSPWGGSSSSQSGAERSSARRASSIHTGGRSTIPNSGYLAEIAALDGAMRTPHRPHREEVKHDEVTEAD